MVCASFDPMEYIHDSCGCECVEVCNMQGHETNQSTYMCTTYHATFNGLTELWTSVLCPKPKLSLWHAKRCLAGACPNCGVKTLRVCPEELIYDKLV
jgi:hypothetical protein